MSSPMPSPLSVQDNISTLSSPSKYASADAALAPSPAFSFDGSELPILKISPSKPLPSANFEEGVSCCCCCQNCNLCPCAYKKSRQDGRLVELERLRTGAVPRRKQQQLLQRYSHLEDGEFFDQQGRIGLPEIRRSNSFFTAENREHKRLYRGEHDCWVLPCPRPPTPKVNPPPVARGSPRHFQPPSFVHYAPARRSGGAPGDALSVFYSAAQEPCGPWSPAWDGPVTYAFFRPLLPSNAAFSCVGLPPSM